jgi:hypothetical protein
LRKCARTCSTASLSGPALKTAPHCAWEISPWSRYAHGELTAIGYDSSGAVAEQKTIKTAGAAAQIRLTADRSTIAPSRNDLSYVTAEVTDAHGILVHDAKVKSSACPPPPLHACALDASLWEPPGCMMGGTG